MPKDTRNAEFWIGAIESLPPLATWNDLIDRTPAYAQNATTGTHYKGSNLVTIAIDKWINGFESNYYVTYNAVKFTKDAKFKDYDGTKKGIPVTKWGIQCKECKIEFNIYIVFNYNLQNINLIKRRSIIACLDVTSTGWKHA